MKLWICLFLFLAGLSAEAKVFKLSDQNFGTYIFGTLGNSAVADSAYVRDNVSFENKVGYNGGGEVGVSFLLSRAWMRLGVELIRPQSIQGAQAVNSAGTTLYRVNSGILAWDPVANFELPIKVFEIARFYFVGGIGYMKVTVKNDYELTDAGRSTFGVTNYSEEATGYSFMGQGGLGMEISLADTATFTLGGGYRYLRAYGLQHERANSTVDGTISAGDTLRSNAGDRVIDLSGAYAMAGFRIYFNY